MKVHHLNCGTMRLPTAPLVCHVMLLESAGGLVLVDTGFGLQDIADPGKRIGAIRHLLRPALEKHETAHRQVQTLGFEPADVRHIVLTHFDLDHIGGLADFPHAQVHLTAAEASGAMWAPTRREKIRFRGAQWAHGPNIVEHEPNGEAWRGFAAAKPLTEIDPDLVLVSLPGHTRGHAAIAVEAGGHWVLQAGDSIYHQNTLEGRPIPRILRVQEQVVSFDLKLLRANQKRLAELYSKGEPDVSIVCSHDPDHLARMRARAN